VNVCSHPRIDPVCGANMEPVSEEHLDTWGLGNTRVPLLVGPTRPMVDADGHDATAVDVLFHPAVVQRAITGGKSVTKEHFRDYLMDIAVKNVGEDHGIKLAAGRTAAMATARYKGPRGENADNTHAFPVLVPEGEGRGGRGGGGGNGGDGGGGHGGDSLPRPSPKSPGAAAHRSPLIEEIGAGAQEQRDDTNPDGRSTDGRPGAKGSSFSFAGAGASASKKIKPIKKGFLAGSGGGGGELYPDGSAEGIPRPGEQYDPLGHIPESVRSKCHVIDSGALSGAELEAVTQQYAKTGTLDTSKRGVYVKGSQPGDRRPGDVGTGHPTSLESLESGKGDAREGTEEDEKGMCSDGREDDGGAAASSKLRDGVREVPAHDVRSDATLGGEAAVEVLVRLPRLKGGMAAVDLDVGPTELCVRSAEYDLTVRLPHRVDAEGAQAKFSTKRMELKVTVPVVLPL